MRWDPFDVDLFAARHNKQLETFFSFRPDLDAKAVDALAQAWGALRPYAFPPFVHMGRCLHKLKTQEEGSAADGNDSASQDGPDMVPPTSAEPTHLSRIIVDKTQSPTLLSNPAGEPHPRQASSSSLDLCFRNSPREESCFVFPV